MLHEFFEAAELWIQGQAGPQAMRKLGPTSASDADLAFYPGLTRHGYHQVLREVFSAVHALFEAFDAPAWPVICDAFLHDHPPSHYILQAIGESFPTWIEEHLKSSSFLDTVHGDGSTAGIVASLSDYQYCQALSLHASDGPGLCLDERVFVRRYPVDVVALGRDPNATGIATTKTVCVFRDLSSDEVKVFVPTVATMAVFAELMGQPLVGALALPKAQHQAERRRLLDFGVFPTTST